MVKLTIFELHSKHRKTHASANTAQRAKAKTQKKKKSKKKIHVALFFFLLFSPSSTRRAHVATKPHNARGMRGEIKKTRTNRGWTQSFWGPNCCRESKK